MEVGSREDAIKAVLTLRAHVAEPVAGDPQSGTGETHYGDCPLARKPAPEPSTAVRVRHAKCVLTGAVLSTL